jgi:hypothetical protein
MKPPTLALLGVLLGGYPRCLTAIIPDGRTETMTFGPDEEEALLAWVREREGRKNIYFHSNPPRRRLTRKAKKSEILHVANLHCDLDPRAGEDRDEERERILKLLRSPPDGVPPPTAIVDSGNGMQGFWHLREPITVEDGEARNRWLANALGGDPACVDASHLMRLP